VRYARRVSERAGLRFRRAERADLDAIVALLADDAIAAGRESAQLLPAHVAAFEAIAADANHELVVGEDAGELVAVLQLTFLPSLTHRGGWRAQVEGVRVASSRRGRGFGHELLRHAIERARARGCAVVQLTSDKRRTEAKRFYESLGFVASHEGMKLWLGA
jgi:ribosomal protein S18 acetylase RimI-like enzyme